MKELKSLKGQLLDDFQIDELRNHPLEPKEISEGTTTQEQNEIDLLRNLFAVADAGARVLKLGAHEGLCSSNAKGACSIHIKTATERMKNLQNSLKELGDFIERVNK